MSRHPAHARRRGARIATVVAVASAFLAVPSGASADTPAQGQPPSSHVVVVNPPFSTSDVKRAPWEYAPLDGTSAVHIRTIPGTETALSILDTLYPGVSDGLPADQVAELAQTKASPASSVSVLGKVPMPYVGGTGDVTLPLLPDPNGDVCPDPNHCSYYMIEMTADKPPFAFDHDVETIQWTWVILSDGSKPSVEHSDFVFKSNQGENWSGSFFRGDGYNNQGASWESEPGVWNWYHESKGNGQIPQFDQWAFGFPVPRSSTNITSAHCAKVTQTYTWRSPIVTRHGIAAQDTFGYSGWNTNPMSGSEPYESYAQPFFIPCGQLQYL